MSKRIVLLVAACIALLVLGCVLPLLPVGRVETGPTRTQEIEIAVPDEDAEVTIAMGLGSLLLSSGVEGALVEGTITYNVASWAPEVTTQGSRVRIRQGGIERIREIGGIDGDTVNEWNLRLGSYPMSLTINTGASEADLDLGGLPLNHLSVNQGASDVELAFSERNPIEMESLRFNAGASKAVLNDLANASSSEVAFKGGAGDYTLDFGGELQSDIQVTVEAGVGQVTLVVPEGVAADARFDGALTNVDASGAWTREGERYVLTGEGPQILFEIKMGVGNLQLRTR